jgi:hypothetical protein
MKPPVRIPSPPSSRHLGHLRSLAAIALSLMAVEAMATGDGQVDITASVSPNPVVVGVPAKFSVAITARPPSTATPTGTVDIENGADTICTIKLPANSCMGKVTGTGSQSLTVIYNGDNNYGIFGITKTISVVPQTRTALNTTPNPSNVGQTVNLIATALGGTNPSGTMTFKDGSNSLCANLAMNNGGATCTTNSLAAGSHSLTAVYSGDGNNSGSTSAVVTQTVQGSVLNLNQFGLTGTWYNSATTGQGFLLSFYPDLVGPGTGFLAGGWFTYDVAPAGGADRQRWYTFSGNAPAGAASAQVTIYAATGGNFNAAPKVPAVEVGQGMLQFADCGSGTFSYTFSDGSGRTGSIPLSRLTANVTCGTSGANGTAPGVFQLSGAWYDPNTSGQGLLFDVNSSGNYLAAAWYTFTPGGSSVGGGASQRWYTLQGPLTAGSKVITNIGVYTSTGGVFDNPTKPAQSQVGTATLTFQNCGTATLAFAFTAGSSAGTSGSINLQRVGAAPAGCNL